MFESAELDHAMDKKTWKARVPPLREALLDAQYDLLEARSFPVVILISGVDGAGKGETVNILNEWLDPRHVETNAPGDASDEERERPPMWRFWRSLPPRGKIGIFFGSWYSGAISAHMEGRSKQAKLDQALERIRRFERMLADEGALVLKFWLHLSRDQQERRLTSLEKNPRTRWRVTPRDWKNFKVYEQFRSVATHVLRATSTAEAPWTVVSGGDPRYRSLTVGSAILSALRARLDTPGTPHPPRTTLPVSPATDAVMLLRSLNLSRTITKKRYEEELEVLQGRLSLLTREPKFRKRAVVAVFEGSDAAGKGGAIRRITQALDAKIYRVVPIAAPTEDELAQPYLWRFWRTIPRLGRFAIFDRSWYGRVLVERVEGFCSREDWMRAYSEINDFEEQLVESRIVVAKFWLAISPEEQLRRFREREDTGFKRFKITEDDWRNREKWGEYEAAACDMIDRTSTEIAPWTLVEAENKQYARIKVLRTLCERIEAVL
ncbi:MULTISPECIES: polyphosphate:AMP phosphotransferase [Geobacter]|uniref:polyphosphate:AMP phosphotransferase n=1 Tax=Geobacter TaxID=28231 RepID=UPI00257456CC|nr:polyphosphate:AMP phosphotransferase [Geobacter sulfurreducens]BEH11273.1 polyphosphate:AMP phosphotransferase [Geobacter sulfurreducens subsp. ethanolicus]BET59121.1 polyphosphate:AMP phosphotransferase [Geobacter sp. 60473]HML79326.1 polyphosphate:AMP phosphotransferase [Geobacter sulfurreducens]